MGSPPEKKSLGTQLKDAAEKKVGGKALKSNFGFDCFALVDKLLRDLNAQTAEDFGIVTGKADYVWGDEVDNLKSLKPGDILQFRNHVVTTRTLKLGKIEWQETESRTQQRPHHTAIVIAVSEDGSVTVVEQNVNPDPKKITRNVIPALEGEATRYSGSQLKTEIKVTGTVKAYRPVPKPKDASLLPPRGRSGASGWRMLASVVPAQGGAKRLPGIVGIG